MPTIEATQVPLTAAQQLAAEELAAKERAAQELAAQKRRMERRLRRVITMRQQKPTLVSPATARGAQDLLDRWDEIWTTYKPEYLKTLEENVRIFLYNDPKYGAALARIHDLEVDLFRLKYASYLYLAEAPKEAQDAALQLVTARDTAATTEVDNNTPPHPDPTPGLYEEQLPFFTTQDWSAILNRMRQERAAHRAENRKPRHLKYVYVLDEDRYDSWSFPTDESTLINLCSTLARLHVTTVEALVDKMDEYVKLKGRGLHYSRAATAEQLFQLMDVLEADIRKLDSAPEGCEEHVPAMREAITDAAGKLFGGRNWKWDEDLERRAEVILGINEEW